MNPGQAIAQQFLDLNPELRSPGSGTPVHAPPVPAAIVSPCNSVQVTQAGGALAQLLMHPVFVPLEVLFRKLPEEGMFTASPSRPFKFELGAFKVASRMAFAFVDYRFDIYRPSGIAAGDSQPIPERSLATILGYDVQISAYRKGQLFYEIDPVPIEATREATAPVQSGGTIGPQPPLGLTIGTFPSGLAPAPQSAFNTAAFVSNASPAGPGASLLPQRPQRQGPLPLPFTYVVRSDQRVQFLCNVFRPIPIPIAFFEVSATGLLLPESTLDAMFEGMKPCVANGGGV